MMLTFLATFILIISNIEMNKMHGKSPFFRASCIWTETPKKDRKTKGTSSISIFSFRVCTNNFWCAVLEFIATQNDNFRCVRKESILDGTRVKLGCEMRCEAGSNIDERANISTIEYGTFSEKACFQAIGFDYLFLSIQWKTLNGNQSVEVEKRHRNIYY
jgi:hypothetical protein